jgi:hypothetical protein
MKERAPTHIQGKARKNLGWFIFALLNDMIQNGYDVNNCLRQIMECIKLVWIRLGAKNRREVLATVITMLCERVKSQLFETRRPQECLDTRPVRLAVQEINNVYDEIANDMKVVPINTVEQINGKIPGSKKNTTIVNDQTTLKMDKAYEVLRRLYGMDDED